TNVGTYKTELAEASCSYADENYTVNWTMGDPVKLIITPADISDKAKFTVENPADVVYDGSSQKQKPTVKDSSGKALTEETDYELSYSEDTTNVGTVTVTITGKGNYTGSTTATYKITPKAVTVKADDKSKEYGADDPELTATVTGTVNGETVAYTISRATGETVEGSPYTITPSGAATQGNYTVTYENGTFTITPDKGNDVDPKPGDDSETMDADSKTISVVYDGNPHTVTAEAKKEGSTIYYKYDGGDWTTTAPSRTDVGETEFAIRAENPNYEPIEKDGYKLIVTPKEVTVTVDNKTKVVGGADPALTATVTGLIGEDTITYTLARAAGETAGTYAITATGAADQGNYTVKFVAGTLTITAPAPDDDDDPTPTPTPGPVIIIPTPEPEPDPDPQPQPNPPVVPAVQPAAAPEPAVIEPDPVPAATPVPTPTATPAPTEIDGPKVPMAQPKYWALINLLSAIATTLIGLGMVITFFRKKKEDEEEEDEEKAKDRNNNEEKEEDPNKRRPSKFLGLIPAIASIILFVLTENMKNPMRLVDKWTIWMIVIALINVVLAYLTRNQKMGRLVFDANGGNGTMSSIVGEMGKDVTIANNAFTNDGYTFAGWNTKADGTGESYGDGDSWKMSEDKPNKLFAQWKH
ncbi:MAG: InlB B-repeat-containing protein, partial [Solobacterium sp.]|nr:InlB B-repeat-containing protein [Solobacterium sp.]